MEAGDAEHARVADVRKDGMLGDAVGEIPQADAGGAAVDFEGRDAVYEHVACHEGVERVAGRGGEGEFGPGYSLSVSVGVCAVASGVLASAVDPQGEAGEDVGEDGGEDEEGLEGEGLVVWSREEEEVVGCAEGLGEERD